MASEWNLWVWLECIGVVSGCCKEAYRFPHNITYPYSTCISSFFAAASLLLGSFLNVFSFWFMLFLCNIANVAQRTFEIVQKSRSHEHGDVIISTRTYVNCARTRVPRLPHMRYRVTFQDSCS